MRISETRQHRLALIAEYSQQRQHYKKEQEHTKRAREASEVGRFYDKETERTFEFGERIPAADPNASVSCGGKRKAEVAEEITHQHKRLKTNTLEMSPSGETKQHLEGIKVRRQEGQPYQGTARQDEGRRAGEEKPTNPYASLKAAKRKGTSRTAVDPPRKAAAKRAERGVESRQRRSKHETVAEKTTVAKDAATPSKKRKAAEDLEEVLAAASDDAKGATSNIYKKRKVVPEAKAEAVADTKPVEKEARVSSGKKRKAADALERGAAQAVVRGDDTASARKKRTKDGPVVETEALVEAPGPSKNVKTDEFPSPTKPVIHPGNLSIPKAPGKGVPNFSKTSGWGRSSLVTTEIVTAKKSPAKGGSSGKRKRD